MEEQSWMKQLLHDVFTFAFFLNFVILFWLLLFPVFVFSLLLMQVVSKTGKTEKGMCEYISIQRLGWQCD